MCCDPVSSPHIGPKESPEEATWAQFADADSDEIYADAGDAKSFMIRSMLKLVMLNLL